MVAIVVTKSAAMPSSCKGHYRKVAVVDVPYWLAWQKDFQPREISERCKEVLRVIRNYGPQSVGKTERCAYQRTIKAATELAHEYNNSRDMATAEQLISTGSA
jgi:hypothetical protein